MLQQLIQVIAECLDERALELIGPHFDLLPERLSGIGDRLLVSHEPPTA